MLTRFLIFALIFAIVGCDEMDFLPCDLSLCNTGTVCINVAEENCTGTNCPLRARCVHSRPCENMRCESGYECIDGVEPECETGACKGTGQCVPITNNSSTPSPNNSSTPSISNSSTS